MPPHLGKEFGIRQQRKGPAAADTAAALPLLGVPGHGGEEALGGDQAHLLGKARALQDRLELVPVQEAWGTFRMVRHPFQRARVGIQGNGA